MLFAALTLGLSIVPHRRAAFRSSGDATGPEEFDIVGATYFVVAPDTNAYAFTSEQETQYGARRYETLFDAESGLSASPSTPQVINIVGDWSGATEDTTAVDFDGTTPTAANYTLVRCVDTEGDTTRHSGIWDDDRYTLSVDANALTISDNYIRIDGLQIEEDNSGNRRAVLLTSGSNNAKIEYCIMRTSSGGVDNCLQIGSSGTAPSVGNCILICGNSADVGINVSASQGSGGYFYNLTIIGGPSSSAIGLDLDSVSANEETFKNCIIEGFATAAVGDVTDASDYNATDLASFGWTQTTPAGNNQVNQTFVFVDSGNDDFHLDPTDTGATDLGTDLSADGDYPITRDIDYETRSGTWDIGADEK